MNVLDSAKNRISLNTNYITPNYMTSIISAPIYNDTSQPSRDDGTQIWHQNGQKTEVYANHTPVDMYGQIQQTQNANVSNGLANHMNGTSGRMVNLYAQPAPIDYNNFKTNATYKQHFYSINYTTQQPPALYVSAKNVLNVIKNNDQKKCKLNVGGIDATTSSSNCAGTTWADMVKKNGNYCAGETRVCAPPLNNNAQMEDGRINNHIDENNGGRSHRHTRGSGFLLNGEKNKNNQSRYSENFSNGHYNNSKSRNSTNSRSNNINKYQNQLEHNIQINGKGNKNYSQQNHQKNLNLSNNLKNNNGNKIHSQNNIGQIFTPYTIAPNIYQIQNQLPVTLNGVNPSLPSIPHGYSIINTAVMPPTYAMTTSTAPLQLSTSSNYTNNSKWSTNAVNGNGAIQYFVSSSSTPVQRSYSIGPMQSHVTPINFHKQQHNSQQNQPYSQLSTSSSVYNHYSAQQQYQSQQKTSIAPHQSQQIQQQLLVNPPQQPQIFLSANPNLPISNGKFNLNPTLPPIIAPIQPIPFSVPAPMPMVFTGQPSNAPIITPINGAIQGSTTYQQDEKFKNTWLDQNVFPTTQVANERYISNFVVLHHKAVLTNKDKDSNVQTPSLILTAMQMHKKSQNFVPKKTNNNIC